MLRKIARGSLLLLGLVVLLGFMMPGHWHVERSIVVQAVPSTVFRLVNDLQRWGEWSWWNESVDPSLRRSFQRGAPTAGLGAAMAWSGDEIGEGRLTITESVPDRLLRYDLMLEHESFLTHGTIVLDPLASGVKVVWTDDGELGMNPLLRLMGPWVEHAVGEDFERGLAGLKRVAEGRRG